MSDDLKCVCLDPHKLHFSQQGIAERVSLNSPAECPGRSPSQTQTQDVLTVALQMTHRSLSSLPRPCEEASYYNIRLEINRGQKWDQSKSRY